MRKLPYFLSAEDMACIEIYKDYEAGFIGRYRVGRICREPPTRDIMPAVTLVIATPDYKYIVSAVRTQLMFKKKPWYIPTREVIMHV